MDKRQEVKALKKALHALLYLNCYGQSKASEVAQAIGIPRTTCYRLLQTLAVEGYIEKIQGSDVYRLTSLVQKLSSGFDDSELVVEVAKPLMSQVGADIRWPIGLATPQGTDMLVRFNTDKDAPLAIDRFRIGFSIPMIKAPTGLCYLAHCNDDKREELLDISSRSKVGMTGLNKYGGLRHLLARVRNDGYSNMRFDEYSEAGFAIPLTVGSKLIGSLIMRYAKSALTDSDVEKIYHPIMAQLSSKISRAYADRRIG